MTLIKHNDNNFRGWRHDQLYFGGPQVGTQYVPNVDDQVTDWDNGLYRVVSVDVNGVPTLELKMRFVDAASLNGSSDSLITALSQYQPNVTSSAYYDNATSPATITIDAHFPVYDQDSAKMLFYKGTDVSVATGELISERYTGGGVFIDNDVSLTAIDPSNPAIKRPDPFRTTKPFVPGDIITGVVYNAAGGVLGKTSFLIINSSTIRPASLSGNAISGISLDSPLVDPSDSSRLLNDANTPFTTAGTEMILHYTNGTTQKIPIDGSKAKILGLSNYDTASVIRPTRIMAAYYPGPSEPYINGGPGFLFKEYTLANITSAPIYALRLYMIPRFVDNATGWIFTYRLANLARDVDLDVTADVVTTLVSGGTFLKNSYAAEQQVLLKLDMDTVAPGAYPGHVHTQLMNITLDIPSNTFASPFIIDYNGDGTDLYGDGVWASASSGPTGELLVNVAEPTLTEWFRSIYTSSTPLRDPAVGPEPPVPTHFRVEVAGQVSAEIPVADFDKRIALFGGMTTWVPNTVVNVVFLLQDGANFGVLSHAPLNIRMDIV